METKNLSAVIDEIRNSWDKDLPQTVIAKFTEVSEQFIKDNDYKGLLVFFKHCLPMSDMLNEEILSILERVEDTISASEDEPLKALFFMIVGEAFRRNYSYEEETSLSKAALAHPEELDVPIKDFEWFVGNDELQIVYDKENSPIFGHTLLTYVAQHTKQYGILAKYYEQANNREATCYAKYLEIEEDYYNREEKLWYLVDSYKDTPVALFAWKTIIEQYILGSNNYKPIEERNSLVSKVVNQLQTYMHQFPNWINIGMSTDLMEKLTEPEAKYR